MSVRSKHNRKVEAPAEPDRGENELPKGWAVAPVGDILNLVNGCPFKPSHWKQTGLPIIRIQNLNNPNAPFNYCSDMMPEKFRVRNGDLLFAWSGTPGTSFGAHIWKGGDAWLNQHIFRVEFDKQRFDRTFLKHAINRNLAEYIEQAHGGAGLAHITKGVFEKSLLPIAPLAEQRRIVGKLELLLEKVSSSQKRLSRIPVLLKRFRKSVLAAACSGKLTADWREVNPDVNKVGVAHQEAIASVAAEFDDACRSAMREGRRKPARPTCLDDFVSAWGESGDLPETWIVTPLGRVCRKITDGTHDTPKPTATGIPFITAKHIRERRIDFENCMFLSKEVHDEIYARCNPETGDVLIVNIGAGTATPALVTVSFQFSLKNVALLKPIPGLLLGQYLEWYQILVKPVVFDQVTRGGAQPFMGLDLIKTIPFHLPPLSEQQEIVRRVEKLFAFADQIEQRLKKAQSHVDRLTQSILAKAFRGELVPTEAELAKREGRDYETAEQLLERVKAEASKSPTPKSTRKKSKLSK